MVAELEVFFDEHLVGVTRDTVPMSFEYASSWLERPTAFPIAAIALRHGPQDDACVQAFFENLLAEGEGRDLIAARFSAKTLFSMLVAVAGDTAGAFVLAPKGEDASSVQYRGASWQELHEWLRAGTAASMQIESGPARVALSGAQDKAAVALAGDVYFSWPLGTSPSTHILKPDIKRHAKVRESAANEAIIMRTASMRPVKAS